MADVRGSTPLGSTVKYTSDLRKHGSEVFCSRQAVRSGPAARAPADGEVPHRRPPRTVPDTARTGRVINNNRRERAS